jgi:hypothetical protein
VLNGRSLKMCLLGHVQWVSLVVFSSVSSEMNVKKLKTRILTKTQCLNFMFETGY